MSHGIEKQSHSSSTPRTRDSTARARQVVAALFGSPAERSFTVRYWNGLEEHAGIASDRPFTLWFKTPGSLRRMLLPPSELAIAETFIDGEVELEGNAEYAMHLGDVIGERIQSLSGFAALLPVLVGLPRSRVSARAAATNQFGKVRRRPGGAEAIQHHYDVGNDFYKLWLDERMVYTCAFFQSPSDSLEDAQAAKLDLICRKLRLERGQRFLDIGCGWGALVMHAAANYGVHATGITLSRAQADLARQRIAAAGLSQVCRVELRDYRDVGTEPEYHRIASVGMMEHVGYDRLPGYFDSAFRVLLPGGVFLNHTIVRDGHRPPVTMRRQLKSRLWKRDEFIHRYVFPDGRLVPLARVVDCAEHSGFEVRDVEALREHYAMTLRHWLSRLEAHGSEAVSLVGERRYRTWRLYLLAAINGFRSGRNNVVQVLLAKCDSSGSSGLPLTREYMLGRQTRSRDSALAAA
jgi:cyclopropane-fatty-acyl-phospholipid synthase